MAANGISTLPTKELRQIAKLDLASADRLAVGNPRSTYDISLLPTIYQGNDIVANPNLSGLVNGRPWLLGVPGSALNFSNPDNSGFYWVTGTPE